MLTRNRPSVTIEPRAYNVTGLPTRYFLEGELQVLLHLFESIDAEVIVEFGVNGGRNPAAVFMNMPNVKRYIGVDVLLGYLPKMQVQRNEVPAKPGVLAEADPRFELILKKRGTFDLTAADLPMADAVFIDADHSAEGVRNDRALALKIVRPGGLVIYHDDNLSPKVQVSQTLNEFCIAGAPIQHVTGKWLAFERIPHACE